MTKSLEKIAGGLADAIAHAKGDTVEGRVAASPDVKAKGHGGYGLKSSARFD